VRCRSIAPALAGLLVLAGCGGRHAGPVHDPAPRPAAEAGSLSGRLTDRGTALALAGAVVWVQDAGTPHVLARTATGSDGVYRAANLPFGVPLRVVSQPVTGAVAYATEVSEPVTLVKGQSAPVVDLACAPAAQAGTLEVARRPQPMRTGRPARIALIQKMDAGGAKGLKVLVRMARAGADGSFRFEAVPAGHYEVRFPVRGRGGPGTGPPRRRRRPRQAPSEPGVEATVKAGETTHVPWPARIQAGIDTLDEAGETD